VIAVVARFNAIFKQRPKEIVSGPRTDPETTFVKDAAANILFSSLYRSDISFTLCPIYPQGKTHKCLMVIRYVTKMRSEESTTEWVHTAVF
jgi:hypothetical protein